MGAPAALNIDLHKCISDNMVFWKSAWTPVFDLASAAASGSVAEAPDTSELMMSMMHVQMAMTRCKITPEMEAILIDSMEAVVRIRQPARGSDAGPARCDIRSEV